MRCSRAVDNTTLRPSAAGVAPPDKPVLPPWGTTATPCARHQRSTGGHATGRVGLRDREGAPRPLAAPVGQVRRHRIAVIEQTAN